MSSNLISSVFMFSKPDLKNLQTIPGVGPRVAYDLYTLGIDRVSCLKGKNPEKLYEKLNKIIGKKQDRCLLYVFRCAVYFAETQSAGKKPNPEKLKWWNWKDKK